MYLTIKAFNKEAFEAFHKTVSNSNDRVSSDIQYDQLVFDGTQITFYNNLTILFKGSLSDAILKNIDLLIDKNLYIGSDEVGVGEGVGPMVAAAVKFKDFESKKRVVLHGIKDSKKMSYTDVKKAAKVIKENSEVELISLSVEKFNETYKSIPNVKKINALMQHKILSKFKGSVKVTDEFVNLPKFNQYLDELNLEMFDGEFILKQKAEDKYLEVAAAAIVAKDYYNEWMIDYCSKNGIPLEIKDKVMAQKLYLSIRSGDVVVSEEIKSKLVKNWEK